MKRVCYIVIIPYFLHCFHHIQAKDQRRGLPQTIVTEEETSMIFKNAQKA